MSTMMSPFGLPEKRLAVTTPTASGSTMMLQGHGEVPTRLQFVDGNHLTLSSTSSSIVSSSSPNIVNTNQNATSSYLHTDESSPSVGNSVGLPLRGWNQPQQHSHSHHHHPHHAQQQANQAIEQHHLHHHQPQLHQHTSTSLGSIPSSTSTIVKRECKSEIIHSGHFMVSQIDDQQDDPNEVDQSTVDFKEDSVVPIQSIQPEAVPKARYPVTYQNPNQNPHQSHQHLCHLSSGRPFAPRRFIDEGLSKLFECMSLAYSGSITSPKWKTFKGLPLKLKDKIRLNNIIWRAWHIQYIIGRDPRVCQFSSPSESESHTKAEAVILEGKYWKRRHTTVVAEYHKWRAYHKNKIKPRPTRHSFSDYHDGRWNEFFSNQDLNNLSVEDDFTMDFSDNLLNSLVPPNVIDFPNPREIARSGMGADFIQPGLTQLQPCLDDFMEPLSDFLLSRVCIMPPLPEESTTDNLKDNWKSMDKHSTRFGAPTTSEYMQMSYGDMLDVSGSNNTGVIKSFNQNQGNGNMSNSLGADSLSNTPTVIQVTGLPQQGLSHNHHPVNSPSAQPQSPNVDVNSGAGSLDMNSMNPLESVNLQVQNNIPYSTQPTQATMNGVPLQTSGVQQQTNSLDSHKNNRLFGSYDCLMDISSMSSGYTNSLDKSDPTKIPCMRNDNVTETCQSPRGSLEEQHFAYPKMPTRSSRHRSRSVSTPHMVFKAQSQQQQQPQQNQQNQQMTSISPPAALNLNDVTQQQQQPHKSTMGGMERSISLPVYSQRRNAIGPLLNAQIMQQSQVNFSSSSNLNALRNSGGNANLGFATNSFNNIQGSQGTPSPDLTGPHPLSVGQYPSESSMGVTTSNISNHQLQPQSQQCVLQTTAVSPSDFTSDSNSLIAQLLSNSGTPSTNSMSAIKDNYDKTSGIAQHHHQLQPQQSLGLYSSHPSLHGSMLTYPTTRQTNLMSSNSGDGIGPTRPLRGRISGRLSDPEPPRGLHALSAVAGLKERVRKISSPAISPPPLLAYSPSSKDSNSSTPLASPQSIVTVGSPSSLSNTLSSIKTVKLKSDTDKLKYKEHRRVCHINAEQKRRCNIKNGFDTLRTLLPAINQNANTKISKAAMLHKAAEYIRTMKSERQQRQDECENLRQQIENLNQTIGVFQSQLPATGAPISCQRAGQVKEQFDGYVKDRSMVNWKFWIFGLVMESLLESYMTTVTTSDVDDMCRSILRWLDQNCSLVTLRREVLNSLRHLSTSTNILTSPSTIREEILETISNNIKKQNASTKRLTN